ncbi:MAG: hypothetical protein WC649_08340 [Desulfobacteria bacterium]
MHEDSLTPVIAVGWMGAVAAASRDGTTKHDPELAKLPVRFQFYFSDLYDSIKR